MSDFSRALDALCRAVTAKRPKTVIDHIRKHGQITTQELKDIYGYNHPPRAVRDVRENGIPIETFRVTGPDGRQIAAYRFGKPDTAQYQKRAGRTALSVQIRDALMEKHGCQCFIYLEEMDERALQIDHRVPYEVGGDSDTPQPDDFMLLSASANRAKSWSCEHCENWKRIKSRQTCQSCYWAYPENYTHIAMQPVRRMDVLWQANEVDVYDALQHRAQSLGKKLPAFVKEIIENELRRKRS